MDPRRPAPPVPWIAAAVSLALAATVLGVSLAVPTWFPEGGTVGTPPSVAVLDLTPALGPTFHPGVILVGGSNSTTSILGGVGVYHHATDFSLPVAAVLTQPIPGARVSNATPTFGRYFDQGGIYAAAWNGSAWLIGGQRSVGPMNLGALVSWRGSTVVNLSSTTDSYFVGGGIWSLGWNGTAWLVGGNSSHGPVLLSLQGTTVQNLTGTIVDHLNNSWVQLLAWNGNEWLIGGQGVFGLLRGADYTDLTPGSAFAGSGEFAAQWNGTAWVVGGFSDSLVVVTGTTARSVLVVPSGAVPALVTLLLPWDGAWLVGGRAVGPAGNFSPFLGLWWGAGLVAAWVDETRELPAAFSGGEVQGGFPAPVLCSGCALLVGEGQYNVTSGYGTGALAVALPPSP